MLDINLRGNLRAFRAAALLFLLALALSCEQDVLIPNTCVGGDCNAYMSTQFYKDSNGYTHAVLDWTREYLPYFAIDVEASRTNPVYYYNDVPVVSAEFDTDTYYVLGDSITFTIPLYNPYTGLETYDGFPIPVQDTVVYLSQFQGMVLPIVQNDTRIYFADNEEGRFTTKRLVGPVPEVMIGDTISVYMRVFWDAGEYSVLKDEYLEKYIIE